MHYLKISRSNLPGSYFGPILPFVNSGSDPRLQQAANRPESDPFVSPKTASVGRLRAVGRAAGLAMALAFAAQAGNAQSVWQAIKQFIGLHGKPEPASASV
ncbi:MAG: hypothetical protein DMG97_25895 [Acidobacteria bacterium]|nr:MAG: hypothetical protein DMG97_25895 [Acidobacteriota bacterium]